MRGSRFWTDRTVIITGASSGIGHALALHLTELGAKLGLIARRRAQLQQLRESIRARGGTAELAVASVDEPDAVRIAVALLEKHLGPCDVLIANAGIHRESPGFAFNVANANAVITTNVLGVVNSLGAVLPGMVRRKRGHIVAISSMAGMIGLPEVGAYSASKAAVVRLMESLRIDLARTGVKVTTICPGFIETPLIADHERGALLFLMSPTQAARRIARAIERGRAEYWFPWQTWLLTRIVRALPGGLYSRLIGWSVRHARRRSVRTERQTRSGESATNGSQPWPG